MSIKQEVLFKDSNNQVREGKLIGSMNSSFSYVLCNIQDASFFDSGPNFPIVTSQILKVRTTELISKNTIKLSTDLRIDKTDGQ